MEQEVDIDKLIEKRQRERNEIIDDIKDGKLIPVKPIPRREPKEVKDIDDLKDGDYVRIIGEIEDIRGPFEFRRQDGSSGKVVFMDIMGLLDKVEVVLWNDDCEVSEQLSENDKIEVDGTVKIYKGEPGIHVGSMILYKKLL